MRREQEVANRVIREARSLRRMVRSFAISHHIASCRQAKNKTMKRILISTVLTLWQEVMKIRFPLAFSLEMYCFGTSSKLESTTMNSCFTSRQPSDSATPHLDYRVHRESPIKATYRITILTVKKFTAHCDPRTSFYCINGTVARSS
jgi:hypothetical protein